MTDTLISGQSNLKNGTFNIEAYTDAVLTYVYYYALLSILLFSIRLSSIDCLIVLSERQGQEISKRYFAALLRQQMAWYDKNETGALINKLSSIRMTLLILLIAPIVMMLFFAIAKVVEIMTCREMRAYDEAGAVANEVISNIRTVTAFNAQYAEVARYEDRLKYARKLGIKGVFITSFLTGSYIFVVFASMGLIFWYGTNLVIEDKITPGTVFAVFWAIAAGGLRLGQAIPQVGVFTAAKLAAGEIFRIIDLKPKIDCMSPHGLVPSHVEGRIEFHNVHFWYPARPDVKILNNISFTVHSGSTVAFVGHSGCGKSTIIGLLLRFYEQQTGKITLDGVPISDLNIEWLRKKIGLVSQEPVIFAATVEENLKLGNDALTENEMIEACTIANAHDFIMKLPQGYKTLIGVGGVQLSGGQKQRIAIARILVRDPKILLFDEATSALDSENEIAVQLALDRVRAGRTTITIAHHLSTIRNADQIIVFKNGEITEMGLHDELMKLNGIYRQAVEAQEIGKDDGEFISRYESISSFSSYQYNNDEQLLKEEENDNKRVSKKSIVSLKSYISEKDHENKKTSCEHADDEVGNASILDILKFGRKELPIIAFALIFTLVRGLSWPIFSIIYSRTLLALSSLNKEQMAEDTVLNTISYFILGIVSGFSTFSSGALFGTAGERMSMRLRIAVFENILRQDLSFFDSECHSAGKLTTRLAIDAQDAKAAIDQRLADVMQGIISLSAAIFVAFLFNWRMAWIGVTTCTILIIMQISLLQYLKTRGQKDAKVAEEAASTAYEYQKLNMGSHNSIDLREQIFSSELSFWLSMSYALSVSFMPFNFAVCYLFGLWLVRNSWSDPYTIFQVIETLNVAALIVIIAASFFPEYLQARVSANLMFHMKDQMPLIDNLSEVGIHQPIEGNIHLKNVYFAYPMFRQQVVLRKFSVLATFGQKIALVGSSGCGKSTVIKLLERFYDVTKGVLFIDGRDIKCYNIRYLRSHIALVDQEPTLFNLSIRDNIAYGLDNMSQDQIEAAAKLANIHDFIVALPQGYNTIVGSKGSQLSGGQKQRIAIARAIIRNPKILILDEATSALDSESEKMVQEALEAARHGRTCIVIAHRLKTVQNADLIVVLKDGRVVECGNHTQLLAQKACTIASYSSYVVLDLIIQIILLNPSLPSQADGKPRFTFFMPLIGSFIRIIRDWYPYVGHYVCLSGAIMERQYSCGTKCLDSWRENFARHLLLYALGLFNCITYTVRRQYRNIRKRQVIRYECFPLSPLSAHRLSVVKRKILVLDLDETLIHSHHDGIIRPMVKPGTPPDFVLRVNIDRHPVRFFVHCRPHVDYFLSMVSQWFDLVIFTASMEIYGSSVADKLDNGKGILQRRYFRQHCTMDYGGYTKDLSAVHADLSSIFILDNSPSAYRKFPQNAIPIRSWFSDPTDTCLLALLLFLDALRFASDVRSILSRNQQLQQVW
ncbi:Multidrug resistance protein pgp-3 [Dirofilaria immitis]|nr:Multidrug resistance protein pgp-3 [Dirofilaria immitis]